MAYKGQNKPSSNIMSINWNINENDKNKLNQVNELQKCHIEAYKTLTEKIFTEHRTPYIYLHSNLTNRPLKMLLDTGATISIIAEKSIEIKSKNIRDQKIQIFGIGNRKKGTETFFFFFLYYFIFLKAMK